jgi:hypothetical protein
MQVAKKEEVRDHTKQGAFNNLPEKEGMYHEVCTACWEIKKHELWQMSNQIYQKNAPTSRQSRINVGTPKTGTPKIIRKLSSWDQLRSTSKLLKT